MQKGGLGGAFKKLSEPLIESHGRVVLGRRHGEAYEMFFQIDS